MKAIREKASYKEGCGEAATFIGPRVSRTAKSIRRRDISANSQLSCSRSDLLVLLMCFVYEYKRPTRLAPLLHTPYTSRLCSFALLFIFPFTHLFYDQVL
jgi:hypothetical protein